MLWPVMERASPCRTPWASSSFMTWGTPPARWRSVVTKRPDGLRSHSTGTQARIASKSSRASGTCAAWAMASRWSTALVDPPIALEQLGGVDFPGAVLAHRFEHAHDGEIAVLVMARLDGAAVHEHGGDVHAGHRDHRARHVLVAPAHGQETIHALGVAGGLDRVGDHLARDERILHSLRAHRDAVAHGDRAKGLRHRPGGLECCLRAPGQPVQPHVAGRDGAVGIGDAHDGLLEVAIPEPHGAEHRAVGSALHSFRDGAAAQVPAHGNKLTANTKPHTTGGDVGLAARTGGPQLSTRIRNFDVFQNSSGSAILRRAPPISPGSPGARGGPRTSCRDAIRYGLSSGNGISVTLVLSIAWNAAGAGSPARWGGLPPFPRTQRERLPPSLTMMPPF